MRTGCICLSTRNRATKATSCVQVLCLSRPSIVEKYSHNGFFVGHRRNAERCEFIISRREIYCQKITATPINSVWSGYWPVFNFLSCHKIWIITTKRARIAIFRCRALNIPIIFFLLDLIKMSERKNDHSIRSLHILLIDAWCYVNKKISRGEHHEEKFPSVTTSTVPTTRTLLNLEYLSSCRQEKPSKIT